MLGTSASFPFKGGKGYYETYGIGYPVVLVHGYCSDGRIWEDMIPSLSTDYQLFVPDLPGYRYADLPEEEININTYADYIKQMMLHAGYDKYILIGHSMGGYAAVAFAEEYSENLKGLGFFHSYPKPDSEERKENRKKTITIIEKFGLRLFARELTKNTLAPDFFEKRQDIAEKLIERIQQCSVRTVIGSTRAMMQRPDRSFILERLKVPVQFLCGTLDISVTYHDSLPLFSLAEITQIDLLEGVAHMGMYESPELSCSYIRNFITLCLTE